MPLPLLAPAEDSTGCLVCGGALEYGQETAPTACALCGGTFPTSVRCTAGHYVCDRCHSATARDMIEAFCARTELRDPVEIALLLMRHPGVKMHGPEHHFLVPAALVAAWSNVTSAPPARRAALVAEARRRSEPVLGGFCGVQGACGAAIGAGTFAALVTGSTPLEGPARSLANRATAAALDLVAGTGGARCCKRDSLLSLLAASRFAREHLDVPLPSSGRRCTFSHRNAECIAADCPFFPRAA